MKGLLNISLILFLLACKQSPEKVISDINIEAKNDLNTITVGRGPDALFLSPDKMYLYVANVEDTLVSVINTNSDSIVSEINGLKNPWGFAKIEDKSKVAVSNYGGSIAILDYNTHSLVFSKDFGTPLGGITSTSNGKQLYVVAIEKNQVFRVDVGELEINKVYKTGNAPDGIGIAPDDSKIYVTNTSDGTISIIDTESDKVKTLKKGGKPELIHSGTDGSSLLISNFENNEAYILDTHTDSITHTLKNVNGPEEVIQSLDGMTYYIVSFKDSKVYAYDTRDYQKLQKEYKVGKSPIGFVQLNEHKAYVSNYGDNSLTILKLKDK